MTKGGGGQKSQKIDDVFYEWPLACFSSQRRLQMHCTDRSVYFPSRIGPLCTFFSSLSNIKIAWKAKKMMPFSIYNFGSWSPYSRLFVTVVTDQKKK